MHWLLQAHSHATNRVDHADEATESDVHEVADVEVSVDLNSLSQQGGSAVGECGVELVVAVPRDVYIRIPRQADQQRLPAVRWHMQDHDGVRPAAARNPGVQSVLLLAGQTLSAIRASDEPVRA